MKAERDIETQHFRLANMPTKPDPLRPSAPSNFRSYFVVAALVLAAGLLRLFLSFQMQVINVDAIGLVNRIGSFYQGITLAEYLRSLPGYWPPLYPILCLLTDMLFHDIELSGKLVAFLSGTGLVLIIFLLAQELYGKLAAVISLCITAYFPVLVYYSSFTTTEMTYLFFLFAGMFVFVKWVTQPKAVHGILMGLSCSAAYLSRPEGILLLFQLLFMGVLIAFYKIWRKKEPFQPYVVSLTACVIAFFILASPYLLHLKQEVGGWAINRGGGFAFALTKETVETKVWSLSDDKKRVRGFFDESYTKLSLLNVFKDNPDHIFGKWTSNFKYLLSDILPKLFVNKYVLTILMVMMLAALIWKWQQMHKHLLLLFMLSPIIITPLYVIELRTQLYIIPVVIILASMFMASLINIVGHRFAGQAAISHKASIAIISVVLICSTFFYYRFLEPKFAEKGRYGLEQKEAGLWLKKNGFPKGKILARKPWAAFYSGNDILPLPLASYRDTIHYAMENNAEYLIIDDLLTTRMRPSVAFLLHSSSTDVKLIYDNERKARHRVRVFSFIHNQQQLTH